MSESKLKNRRSFSPEFKLRVVIQVISGQRSIADLSRELKIKDSLIAMWRDRFLESAPAVFGGVPTQSEKIQELEREIGRQHMEIEILKKASKMLH
jgi:Transposase and inactivated derivatives